MNHFHYRNREMFAEDVPLKRIAQEVGTPAYIYSLATLKRHYISTGMKKSKFGVDIKKSLETYKKAASLSNIDVVGVDCHIGSQLTSVTPFVDALSKVREYLDRVLAGEMKKEGTQIRYLD